jgi:hypothetical protein
VITRELKRGETSMKLSGKEQIGTGAKSLAETAKPLFIGSIPIAASNLLNNLRAAESITEK